MWRIAMALLRQNYPLGLVLVPVTLLGLGIFNAAAQDNSAVAVAPQAALPASIIATPGANWRNDIGVFKIGLVRGWSSDMSRLALGRVENIFAKALGTPVKVVVFERFTSLMDAQADGRIDLAAYSARAFATVRLMCECVDALATPGTLAGDTGQIAILAGDALRISSLTAIGSAKLGRVATANVTTQDMLRGTLMVSGKAVTGKEDFWVDYTNYSAAIQAYQNNDIDGLVIPAATSFAGITDAGQAELAQISLNGTSARQATALWRSSFWPYGAISVRTNLAAEAKDILLRTLEQLDVIEPLAHATLSEGLPGPFRKTDTIGYVNVSASIRLLVSQNANWR
jgi:phosphonate transport system substrate-binding protein